MAIQVPQIPQRPQGGGLIHSILPIALQSILWPARQEASQKATEERVARQAGEERTGAIESVLSDPEFVKKLGAPAAQGATLPPEAEGPPTPTQDVVNRRFVEQKFPEHAPYGTSSRYLENMLAEYGLPGGKVKLEPSFTGYGPSGETLSKTQPVGVGLPGAAKAPALMTGITPEGGQTVMPKVPGAAVSTPGGLSANVVAKQAPKLVAEMGPNGEPIQKFEKPEFGKTLSANPQNLRFRFRESIPGSAIMVDNMTGRHVMFPDGINPVVMTPNETQAKALQFLSAKPVSNVLAMKQMAPTVRQLISETKDSLAKAIAAHSALGPAGGRFSDFVIQRVGAGDPEYMALAANLELVPTLVGKMHFGSRAPVEVINKFRRGVDPAHQSPENIVATLNAWDLYAEGTSSLEFEPGGPTVAATREKKPVAPGGAGATFAPLPGETYDAYKARAAAAGVK
jgi:hypothetical protein